VLEDLRSSYGVIEGCTADEHHQQQAQDINTDVALAPVDFLATVIPALAPLFGRLHRLTIDAGGTRGGLLRGRLLPADFRA
jgi:hypothetical protein